MKTTVLFWDRGEGKTEEIINLIHDNKRTSMNKIVICHSIEEVTRLNNSYNVPLKTSVITFGQLKAGALKGSLPDYILIDNAEYMPAELFEKEIKPLLPRVKELVLTGSTIKVFKHYRQPEDVELIRDAKELVFKLEGALKYFNAGR